MAQCNRPVDGCSVGDDLSWLLLPPGFVARPDDPRRRLAGRAQDAEKPVRLLVGTGTEPDCVGAAAVGGPRQQRPQAVDGDDVVVAVAEEAEVVPAVGVRADLPVAEVADQQRAKPGR
jgi:hypothetical protein